MQDSGSNPGEQEKNDLEVILEALKGSSKLQERAFGKALTDEEFEARFGQGASTEEFIKIATAMGIEVDRRKLTVMFDQMIEKLKRVEF